MPLSLNGSSLIDAIQSFSAAVHPRLSSGSDRTVISLISSQCGPCPVAIPLSPAAVHHDRQRTVHSYLCCIQPRRATFVPTSISWSWNPVRPLRRHMLIDQAQLQDDLRTLSVGAVQEPRAPDAYYPSPPRIQLLNAYLHGPHFDTFSTYIVGSRGCSSVGLPSHLEALSCPLLLNGAAPRVPRSQRRFKHPHVPARRWRTRPGQYGDSFHLSATRLFLP